MDINNLKYFEKVAKLEHMTKAAKELNIAQPALSQTINKLEKELGVQLFMPKGRNIVLTKYGENFLEIIEPIIKDFDGIKGKMSGLTRKEDLTININVLAASMVVTDAILKFKKDNDEVHFNYSQSLTKNRDIVISTTRDEIPEDKLTKVFYEEILLAVTKDDELSKSKSVGISELKDKKFISIYGKPIRDIIDSYCKESGFIPNFVFQSDNTKSVREFIEAGIGVGFWPAYTWGGRKNEKLVFLPIEHPKCYRNIVVNKKVNKVKNDTVDKFYDYLIEYFERLSL